MPRNMSRPKSLRRSLRLNKDGTAMRIRILKTASLLDIWLPDCRDLPIRLSTKAMRTASLHSPSLPITLRRAYRSGR